MSISADPDTNAAGSGTPGYVRISTSGGTAIAELKAGIASGECNFGREISQGGKVTLLTGVMLEGNP